MIRMRLFFGQQWKKYDCHQISTCFLLGKRFMGTFQPGDIVIARQILRPDRVSLSKALIDGKMWNTPFGILSHSDIIGQPPRTVIHTHSGAKFIVSHPTLEDYLIHRRRDAQPIYPLDAHAIVGLADIHVSPLPLGSVTSEELNESPETTREIKNERFDIGNDELKESEGKEESKEIIVETESKGTEQNPNDPEPIDENGINEENLKLENFEASGENGLERAIPKKKFSSSSTPSYPLPHPSALHFFEAGTGHGSLTLSICKAISAANPPGFPRGAILHSIDRNSTHSETGKKNVIGFRRGMYKNCVEFYVDDSPEQWLESTAAKRLRDQAAQNANDFDYKEAFLDGVFLDLASPEDSFKQLARFMVTDAPMIVFCPSISQIQQLCDELYEDHSIDLTLTTVVELMPGMGGSMRAWDVRTAIIRKTGNIGKVCRPRVGARIVGGGFAAVFRKLTIGVRSKKYKESEIDEDKDLEVDEDNEPEADKSSK